MDVVVGVSGSSPAYVFMFLEAMADAAVADGMPRAQAYKFAAQRRTRKCETDAGNRQTSGRTERMVCSPAGTTIQAVRVLEEKGTAQCSDRGTDGVREESKRNVIFLRKQK